jgi:hypothetical protein
MRRWLDLAAVATTAASRLAEKQMGVATLGRVKSAW